MKATQRVFDTTVRAAGPRKYRFTISTDSPDRMRDTIAPSGWRLDAFLRNPVVLWAHDSSEPPIARASDVRVAGNALAATVEFPEPGTYDRADEIRRLLEQDFIRATSVGFLPIKWKYNEARGGVDFQEQELLEFSLVPVPANPACVVGPSKSLDWRQLDKFLGAPRGIADDFEFDLAAIPARDGREVDLTRADVVGAMREAIPAMVGAAVRTHVSALSDDAQILELDDDDVTAGLTPDDVRSAMAEVISGTVAAQVRRAIGIAKGRVD